MFAVILVNILFYFSLRDRFLYFLLVSQRDWDKEMSVIKTLIKQQDMRCLRLLSKLYVL